MLPEEYFTPKTLQNKLQVEQALKYKVTKEALEQDDSENQMPPSVEHGKTNEEEGKECSTQEKSKSESCKPQVSQVVEKSVSLRNQQQENSQKIKNAMSKSGTPEVNKDEQDKIETISSSIDSTLISIRTSVDGTCSVYTDCEESTANDQAKEHSDDKKSN